MNAKMYMHVYMYPRMQAAVAYLQLAGAGHAQQTGPRLLSGIIVAQPSS